MKLNYYFLLLFFSFVQFPVLISVFIILNKNRMSSELEVTRYLKGASEKKATQIESYLVERLREIGHLSHNKDLVKSFIELKQTFQKDCIKDFIFKSKVEIFDKKLVNYFDRQEDYDFLLLDINGDIIYSFLKEGDFCLNLKSDEIKGSGLEYGFQRSLYFLNPNLSPFTNYIPSKNKLAAFLTAPILNDGVVIGVLAIQINLSKFVPIIAYDTGLGISEDTHVIMMKDQKMYFSKSLKNNSGIQFDTEFSSKNNNLLYSSFFEKSDVGVIDSVFREEMLVAWRFIPMIGMSLFVKIPVREALAHYFDSRNFIVLSLLTLFIFTSILSYYFGNKLLAPIRQIALVAQRMGNNDFSYKAIEKGPLEILELAQILNKVSYKLSNFYLSLENEIQVRTYELRVSKEKAEEATKVKSAFLANMSHEIRTPLHSILGFAEVGIKKCKDQSPIGLKDCFEEIQESGRKLLDLLNDVLDVAKFESGKMNYNFENTNLIEIVNESVKLFYFVSNKKNISIRINQELDFFLVPIDRLRMLQVFNNLLSNAIKFSFENSIIDINLKNDKNDNVHVEVINEGVGIPEGEVEIIFEKFIQSSKTNTGAGGTGLGLTIVNEIIKDHKGKISAEMRGHLTVFQFKIPIISQSHF